MICADLLGKNKRTPLGFFMPSVIRDQIINGSPETRRKASSDDRKS